MIAVLLIGTLLASSGIHVRWISCLLFRSLRIFVSHTLQLVYDQTKQCSSSVASWGAIFIFSPVRVRVCGRQQKRKYIKHTLNTRYKTHLPESMKRRPEVTAVWHFVQYTTLFIALFGPCICTPVSFRIPASFHSYSSRCLYVLFIATSGLSACATSSIQSELVQFYKLTLQYAGLYPRKHTIHAPQLLVLDCQLAQLDAFRSSKWSSSWYRTLSLKSANLQIGEFTLYISFLEFAHFHTNRRELHVTLCLTKLPFSGE